MTSNVRITVTFPFGYHAVNSDRRFMTSNIDTKVMIIVECLNKKSGKREFGLKVLDRITIARFNSHVHINNTNS